MTVTHKEIQSKPFHEIVRPIAETAKRSECLIDVAFQRAFGNPMIARIAWDADIDELHKQYHTSKCEVGSCRTFKSTFGY